MCNVKKKTKKEKSLDDELLSKRDTGFLCFLYVYFSSVVRVCMCVCVCVNCRTAATVCRLSPNLFFPSFFFAYLSVSFAYGAPVDA